MPNFTIEMGGKIFCSDQNTQDNLSTIPKEAAHGDQMMTSNMYSTKSTVPRWKEYGGYASTAIVGVKSG